MSRNAFFLQLLTLSALTAAGIFFVNQTAIMQSHGALNWAGLGFFFLFCTLMYFAGHRAAHSRNKNDFTNTFLGFTAGKMFMTVIIVYVYLQIAKPEDKLFILPFFGIYLIYTIFEVYFMSRLGRMGK